MYTLNANEATTKFDAMIIKTQLEPVKITKNGNPVAVVLSLEAYEKFDQLKMELVKSRFENIDENDLVDGKLFREELSSGKYD